jgi:hypothetical protein
MIALAELRVRCGLDAGDTSKDATLTSMEAGAVQWIEAYTGRHFGAVAAQTEVLDGGGPALWLSSDPNPAGAVTGVDEWDASSLAWEALEAAAYRVEGRRLFRSSGEAWTHGYGRWRVRYPAGYAAGSEPPTIRECVISLVRSAFGRESTATGGVKSEKIGDYGYTLEDAGDARVSDGRSIREVLYAWKSHAWTG